MNDVQTAALAVIQLEAAMHFDVADAEQEHEERMAELDDALSIADAESGADRESDYDRDRSIDRALEAAHTATNQKYQY